jgi:hypothetical protein
MRQAASLLPAASAFLTGPPPRPTKRTRTEHAVWHAVNLDRHAGFEVIDIDGAGVCDDQCTTPDEGGLQQNQAS